MKVAVVGATGLVGTRMIQVLEERQFPVDEFIPVASERSVGKTVVFRGQPYTVVSADEAIARRPALAIFSAGAAASRELAPRFAAAGCRVVDNSSCWRMDPDKKLVVPEINADVLTADDRIIANPNCSTIQMLLPLAPLHRAFTIKRVVVSTYQSITGTGQKAVVQMAAEREGKAWGEYPAVYPYPIDGNILPHIDSFLDNGYTKEEMKMVNETHKILDSAIAVSATTVRVPVRGGHSESVNVEFEKPFELEEVRRLLAETPGVVVQDDPARNVYPMPLYAEGRDEVFVGRIRRDSTVPSGLNFWCVADNLRKGAATNAVQIAEVLLQKKFLSLQG
ncbi:MAG: aspartate-semialdehyde dehydrogenase [Bacteroidales bacterium]|nr:aspartate-semialdehyde dehydrogenase [Bacteroidales bacterium]